MGIHVYCCGLLILGLVFSGPKTALSAHTLGSGIHKDIVLRHDPSDAFFVNPHQPSPIKTVKVRITVSAGVIQSIKMRWWDWKEHWLTLAFEKTEQNFEIYSGTLPASTLPKYYRFQTNIKSSNEKIWLNRKGMTIAPNTYDDFLVKPQSTSGWVVHYDASSPSSDPAIRHPHESIWSEVGLQREADERFGIVMNQGPSLFVFRDRISNSEDRPLEGDGYQTSWNEIWIRDKTIYSVDPTEYDPGFVDAHTHPIPADILLQVMKDNNVGCALASTVGDHAAQKKFHQLTKENPRLIPLRWFDPRTDTLAEIEEDLRDRGFKGLKYHPPTVQIKPNDPKLFPFIDIAQKYSVPVVIHTAVDELSRPALVADLAKKFPKVQFVFYHLELGAFDKNPAIGEALKAPNISVETSWTNATGVLNAINRLGSKRVLFGTDAVTDGLVHFTRPNIPDDEGHYTVNYRETIQAVKDNVDPHKFDDWVFRNTLRLFKTHCPWDKTQRN